MLTFTGRFRVGGLSLNGVLRPAGRSSGAAINAAVVNRILQVKWDDARWLVCFRYSKTRLKWTTKDSIGQLLRPVIERDIQRPAGTSPSPVFTLLTRFNGMGYVIPALEKRKRSTKCRYVERVCEKAIQFQRDQP